MEVQYAGTVAMRSTGAFSVPRGGSSPLLNNVRTSMVRRMVPLFTEKKPAAQPDPTIAAYFLIEVTGDDDIRA
jgi:hypothetical protein